MINKRILIFGLIAILCITAVKLGTNLVKENMASINKDEIEVIRSDIEEIEFVEDDGLRQTVFYFKNSEGYLVPVMKRIPWEEGIGRITLQNMVDTKELRESLAHTDLIPIIPAGTKVIGMTVDNETGICKVDFSKEIKNVESKEDEENMIKGIVYTLTEFSTIQKVQFMVEGQIVKSLNNDVSIGELLSREDINLINNKEDFSSKVVVYYTDQDDGYFVPVTIPTLAPVSNVYSALDELFQGPPEGSSLKSYIPDFVKLQGVEIKEGIAFVDLNMLDKSCLSDEISLNGMMKNIGLTLKEFGYVESVELLIDGETINTSVPVFANEY